MKKGSTRADLLVPLLILICCIYSIAYWVCTINTAIAEESMQNEITETETLDDASIPGNEPVVEDKSEEQNEVKQEVIKEVWKTRYCTADLRLRKGRGTKYGIITTYPKGTKVKVLIDHRSSKWYKVKVTKNGKTRTGYMSKEYLSKNKPKTESKSFLGYYQLTAYAPTGCRTASGTCPCAGRTVAINGVKLGTRVYIKGYGTYTVEDTGGMGYGVIDIFMNSESECISFGRKYNVPVYIVK